MTQPKQLNVFMAYDGSDCADGALHDLRRAGLPHDVEAVVITVADLILPPPLPVIADAVKSGFPSHLPAVPRGTGEQAFRAVKGAYALATRARERLQAGFPAWDVPAEAHGDSPAWAIVKKADAWQLAHRMVAASTERLRKAGLVVSSVIKAGDPTQWLPEEAEHWKADSIFVGARGLRHIERFFLGSVSAAVAARAHGSVEVIRAGQKT